MGALVLSIAGSVVIGFLMAIAPLHTLNPNQGRVPAHVDPGMAGHIAVVLIIIMFLGVLSHGVGAGILAEMKNRKKK